MDSHLFDDLVQRESYRQQHSINLIASENYVSENILRVLGSVLTNKYVEGYPYARYYSGCEHIDHLEMMGVDLAKKLFPGATEVNLHPHAGAIANLSIFLACASARLKPKIKIMGMRLQDGGHLTHGSAVNITGILFDSCHYRTDSKGWLDYNHIREVAQKEQPDMIVAGYSSYPRKVDWKKFKAIADEVGAFLLTDISHIAGLIVAGLHESPFPYADVVMTTTHKTLRGPKGAMILSREGPLQKYINKSVFPGTQGGTLVNNMVAKIYALDEALQPSFKTYQEQVVKNAKKMEAVAKELGFKLVSDGTDTHMLILDLSNLPYTGQEVANILSMHHIYVNKNCIPGDKRSAKDTSGIRIGTPAITTRGYKEEDCENIMRWIHRILNHDNKVKAEIEAFLKL